MGSQAERIMFMAIACKSSVTLFVSALNRRLLRRNDGTHSTQNELLTSKQTRRRACRVEQARVDDGSGKKS
jgi:hypothetical protein